LSIDLSREKIEQIFDQSIRPSLRAHQGGIELIEITSDGIIKVGLTGACATCPSAQHTMEELVRTELMKVWPGLKDVVLSYRADDELIEQALKILRKGGSE
jgi:Fe-S cluster biogenesis protein NfuA